MRFVSVISALAAMSLIVADTTKEVRWSFEVAS
jgi:hypothetical protein